MKCGKKHFNMFNPYAMNCFFQKFKKEGKELKFSSCGIDQTISIKIIGDLLKSELVNPQVCIID